MQLYNTLTRSVEEFKPLQESIVTMYCCGPTVYDYTHIGHIRKYVMDDILRRTLQYLGYDVKQVMNITDVGHLTDDADAGEDKLEKGAAKTGKTVTEVAQFYTDFFKDTMNRVNVELPPQGHPSDEDLLCKATDHIQDMINLIKVLESKGFTYTTDEAIYFDTTKFPPYGNLSGQKIEDKKQAVREGVHIDAGKKHPADFALWFFRTGRFANHTMHWNPKEMGADFGDGFPGWHIECSAMSMHFLGDQIDIHTGGIDHIPVHHENEIAQSEAATGKKFVNYWIHHNFLMVDGQKMSKSLNNFYKIDDVIDHGIDPISLRYLFMQTHYRQEMNFTWESAMAANEAYKRLVAKYNSLRVAIGSNENNELTEEEKNEIHQYEDQFKQALENDLQMSKALAVMWDILKSPISDRAKVYLLQNFDRVFGLLHFKDGSPVYKADTVSEQLPSDILALKQERDTARTEKNWQQSDELRQKIEEKGYTVEDTSEGTVITRK